jgi:hypothetical protein
MTQSGRVEPLADATVVHRLVSTHRRKNRRPEAAVQLRETLRTMLFWESTLGTDNQD